MTPYFFLLIGSCCQQKLLAHITLQSRRGWCYGSMWVILGHSAVVTKKSGQPMLRLERGTLSWYAQTTASPYISLLFLLTHSWQHPMHNFHKNSFKNKHCNHQRIQNCDTITLTISSVNLPWRWSPKHVLPREWHLPGCSF